MSTPAARRERLALLAAALVGIQVGACIAASRWLVHDLGPLSLTFLRYAIGLACLLPLVRGWRPAFARLGWRDGAALAALGIAQFGVLIALLNFGLRHLDAGLGALIFATFPLLTLAFATWVGHERFDALLAAGVLVSVAGVAVALGVHPPSQGNARMALGAACVLAAAICGAVCAVLYRPLLRRHAMLPMGALAMAAAVIVLGPAAWAEGLAGRAAALPTAQWVGLGAVGLSSGLSYAVWLWALKHTSSTKATTFLALSPVTAAVIGALALGEPLGLGLWLGMLGILVGLILVAARQEAASPGPEPYVRPKA